MPLQAGAAAGLTLSEIGNVLSRPLVGIDEEPSELEKLCAAARAEVVCVQTAVGESMGARWSSVDSYDDWDRTAGYEGNSDSDTGTPHMLLDVQVCFVPIGCSVWAAMHRHRLLPATLQQKLGDVVEYKVFFGYVPVLSIISVKLGSIPAACSVT